MRITDRETSSKARWSLRLALFMAQLIVVTILLHRFAGMATPIATNLIVVSLIGTATAILLAILAFAQIWNSGIRGTGIALTALLVSLMIFAVPLYHLPNLIRLPAINDITTDLLSPPPFRQIAALRDRSSNSVNYPGNIFISAQAKAYPDISTLILERSHSDSYLMVHGVIEELGWNIVSEQQPGEEIQTGYIEAVDRSQLLGFSDDIVIRVQGDAGITRIDVRSASRYGRHDLGSNANRIRELFGVIKTRIARAEAKRIDIIESRRIAKRSIAERKIKERKRLARLKKKEAERVPIMLPKANFDQVGLSPEFNSDGSITQPGQAAAIGSNRLGGQRSTTASKKQRTQKISRSKRKRKRRKWVPFKEWP
jgi:uncharacterized protein (DUF1499 family)